MVSGGVFLLSPRMRNVFLPAPFRMAEHPCTRLVVINGGPDVRCSANFVEGKGREMTYKLQSPKGAWVAKRHPSDNSLCTTEVWPWPFIAL